MGNSGSRKNVNDGVVVPAGLSPEERKKFLTKSALERKIANEDPDSNIKFVLTDFPINDLLNSDSFITMYPDILDIIFYNPGIVKILKRFRTASGFVCQINSLKTVKLSDWVVTAVTKNTANDEFGLLRDFLGKYVETQMFNALLKNTAPDDHGSNLDPQEYFDEVAAASAEAITQHIVPQNVKPQLFSSKVDYSVYPVSVSVTKNDMLKNLGVLVTLSGNIGIEKSSGGFLKKGSISVLLDMTLKVIVFNSYIYSRRGLTLTLNGIRERRRIHRSDLLDEDISRQSNQVSYQAREAWHSDQRSTDTVQRKSTLGDIARTVDGKIANAVGAKVNQTVTNATGGLNRSIAPGTSV